MSYKIKTNFTKSDEEKFSIEFGTFVLQQNITSLEKQYKRISPNIVEVIISGEEADILRFQARSRFQFEHIME